MSTQNSVASSDAPEPAPALEAERPARLLVAGSQDLAAQLAQQLPNDWQVVLVAPAVNRPEDAAYQVYPGEPTSALALQRAGAGDSRALLAALADYEANLEVCRIAQTTLQVPRVVAVVPTAGQEADFRAMGIEVISQTALVATAARGIFERASVVAEQFGLGGGELVQITLHPPSPIVGRRLRVLRQHGWAVVAIFRENRVVLPTPEAMLQREDRLLLAGEPGRLSGIAEYLRLGRAGFPLRYGGSIAGPVWGAPSEPLLREVAYLAHGAGLSEISLSICGPDPGWRTLAETLRLPVSVRWSESQATAAEAVSEVVSRLSPGCLVVPALPARLPRPFAGTSRPLARALSQATVPILIPRGSFPYEDVLVPVAQAPLPQSVTQVAFDLAEQLGAHLLTVHVQVPAGLEQTTESGAAIASALNEVAALRRSQIQHLRRVGNPLTEISRLYGPKQLLLLSHRQGHRRRLLRPDVSVYLAQRAPSSVIVLPVEAG